MQSGLASRPHRSKVGECGRKSITEEACSFMRSRTRCNRQPYARAGHDYRTAPGPILGCRRPPAAARRDRRDQRTRSNRSLASKFILVFMVDETPRNHQCSLLDAASKAATRAASSGSHLLILERFSSAVQFLMQVHRLSGSIRRSPYAHSECASAVCSASIFYLSSV